MYEKKHPAGFESRSACLLNPFQYPLSKQSMFLWSKFAFLRTLYIGNRLLYIYIFDKRLILNFMDINNVGHYLIVKA